MGVSMSKRTGAFACVVLLLLAVPLASLLAGGPSLSIRVMPGSEAVGAMRYQTGVMPDKPWKRAPLSGTTLALEKFDPETEYLFVQQGGTEDSWGGLYAYQYDRQNASWSAAAFPPKGPVRIRIRPADTEIQMLRYQYGTDPDQGWQIVDDSTSLAIEQFDSGKEFLFLQQADEKKEWGSTYAYRYDYLQQAWSLVPPKVETKRPANLPSFDVKAFGLLPIGRCENLYTYVAGGAIQVNGPVGKVLGHTGLSYRTGPPKSVWVNSHHSIGLSIGLADVFQVSERVEVIPELGYGVVLHFLEADFDMDGTYSFEFFINQQVRFSLYLTYALNEKYKLFFAPMGVAQFETNAVGFMYGCQAGLRVSL